MINNIGGEEMGRFIGLIVFIVIFFGAENFAFTQDAQPGAVSGQTEEAVSGQTEEMEGVIESSQGKVTLDFKDADITNVLRILSFKSG
ncbi:hypothetical protein ACFL0P_07780, partial [Candidatus Omnitrophota bacterium]